MQASELEPQLEASDRAYHGAELKIVEAMGENLGPSAYLPEPAGELKYARINIDLPAEVLRTLRRRPDLELARLVIRASKEDERILEAAYYPMIISPFPATTYQSPAFVASKARVPLAGRTTTFHLKCGLVAPTRGDVIDNGQTYGAVKTQRSAREINELLLHKMEQDIPREMARIDRDLKAIAAKQQLLSGASAAAAQNSATVEQNLGNGIVSQLDYRLVENASLEVQSGLLTLAYQQRVALAEWDRATGRYFQFSQTGSRH